MTLDYLAFTGIAFVASILCLYHAWGDRTAVSFYGSAVIYGILLEKATILQFQAYTYPANKYLLSIFGIPIAIGLGWSVVLYTGYVTAKSIGVSRLATPFFVGLYALHLDLSMDAIAIRVPFWVWRRNGVWFGVPLGNFFGWFSVAVLFTGSYQVLSRRYPESPILCGVGSIVAAFSVLSVVLNVWEGIDALTGHNLWVMGGILTGLVCISIVIVVLQRFAESVQIPSEVTAAILLIHLFFITIMVSVGVLSTTPLIGVVAVCMVIISATLHMIPRIRDVSTESGTTSVFAGMG